MSVVFLKESEIHSLVSGKNKAYMTRTINKQKKYGNYNIFDMIIDLKERTIRISLGESQGIFKENYHTKEWEREYGNIYCISECTDIVREIAKKYF